MLLTLLRHADKIRSTTDHDVDLSYLGIEQAHSLVALNGFKFPQPTKLLSSPKKRAVSTVDPLAKKIGLKVQPRPELDERRGEETRIEFEQRVLNFLTLIGKANQNVLACTHADWLAQALQVMPSNMYDPELLAHFHMAQFRVFEFDGVLWHYRQNYGS